MRFYFLALILACICLLAKPVVAQTQAPQGKRYWDFYRWYRNHSVLNVVISGESPQHLREVIGELRKVKSRGILIGDVVIIQPPAVKDAPDTGEQISALLRQLGTTERGAESSVGLVKKYNIQFSPTWIVNYQGKQYIYEGLKSPLSLFTSEGNFRGE